MVKIGMNNKLMPVIVFCSVFVIVLIMLHFFVGRAVIGYANKIKAEWKVKQSQLQESERLIKDVPNPRKAIEEIEQRFSDLSDMGVTRTQIPRLVQVLGKSTVDSGMQVLSIKPREDIKLDDPDLPTGVSKAFIEMELLSTYRIFGEYVKNLPDLQPGFAVESVEMYKAPETQQPGFPERPDKTEARKKTDNEASKEAMLFIKLIVSTYMVWEL